MPNLTRLNKIKSLLQGVERLLGTFYMLMHIINFEKEDIMKYSLTAFSHNFLATEPYFFS